MILVTGATGNIGRELVRELTERDVHFRAMVRNESDAESLREHRNIEPVIADFEDEAALTEAMQGIERAFLLTPSLPPAETWQCRFVAVATSAGVHHIVKQSQLHADPESPVRFLRYHAAVEAAIRASGMDWTFLRPNLFMQGLLMFSQSIANDGSFAIAAGDAKVSVVDVRDIAAAAAAALTEPGHAGKIWNLTGPDALSHGEMAAELSRALDRPVEYVELDEATMRDSLYAQGMPAWMADGLVEDYAHYRRGEAEEVANGVLGATGSQPRTFAGFVRDYADVFQATQ